MPFGRVAFREDALVTEQPEPVPATRWQLERVAETGSTNDDVLRRAEAGAPEGLVRVAGHQTAGRGRLDRRWEAPPGASLLLSVLLRPPPTAVPLERVHLCTKAVALAALDAVRPWSDAPIGLKWPNDLVVETEHGTRKLAGILAESRHEGGALTAVVVGIGVNITWPAALPSELADVAVALNHLRAEGQPNAGIDDVLTPFLVALERWYGSLLADGGVRLLGAYRETCRTLGRSVRVEQADGTTIEGIAEAIDDDGALVVATAAGSVAVRVGDVVHLRPT